MALPQPHIQNNYWSMGPVLPHPPRIQSHYFVWIRTRELTHLSGDLHTSSNLIVGRHISNVIHNVPKVHAAWQLKHHQPDGGTPAPFLTCMQLGPLHLKQLTANMVNVNFIFSESKHIGFMIFWTTTDLTDSIHDFLNQHRCDSLFYQNTFGSLVSGSKQRWFRTF